MRDEQGVFQAGMACRHAVGSPSETALKRAIDMAEKWLAPTRKGKKEEHTTESSGNVLGKAPILLNSPCILVGKAVLDHRKAS